MSNYLGQAGAYAMHKKYKAGTQTYNQIEAERTNLMKAREAKGTARTSAHKVVKEFHRSTAATRASAGRDRALNMKDINRAPGHVLGDRWMHYEKKAKIRKPRATGRFKKFSSVIGPGKFDSRTSWGKARKPSAFRKVLKPRKHRFKHQTHWRTRGHVVKPQ